MTHGCDPKIPASPTSGKPVGRLNIRAITLAGASSTPVAKASCCAPMPVTLEALSPSQTSTDGTRTAIRILQMDCPTEEAMLRKKLATLSVVKSLEFNLMQRVLTVVHEPEGLSTILDEIRALGFEPEIPTSSDAPQPVSAAPIAWWPLAVGMVTASAAEVAHWAELPTALVAPLALLALLCCGVTTYKKGWLALRNGNLNINALMSIAVTGALALGQWPEAAMVMVLFALAEWLEAKSLDRARHAISGLLELTPDNATVEHPDGSWREVAASAVQVQQRVRIKPGERIPLDGILEQGYSSVNQAAITGESLPVDKAVGDPVFAGTLNGTGSFEYRVTADARHSTLARIIHAIEAAQGAKAPTQRFIDQFARLYTPIVFGLAILIALLPPLLFAQSWPEWIYNALVLLVIACPCALVISTPITLVSGLAAAARHGILIKGGAYLEAGHQLAWLALDKTGTLTHGQPEQTAFETLSSMDATRCRQLAAALAQRSDHPVSQAICRAASHDSLAAMQVEAFEALPGRGLYGKIDGKGYWLGNQRLVQELERGHAELELRLTQLEQQGQTVVCLLDEQQVLALFAVADTVKANSLGAIAELHQLGVNTVMLTGDNAHTAAAIASAVGIQQVRSNQLPGDKLQAIEALVAQGVTGMVGDGINDAPALARANIGFAMGALGSDTAIETADVALMDDDLRKIPTFIRLSRATRQILIQNITLALGIKTLFLIATLLGHGTLWMAVFADVGASLLVIGNGLRLLRK